MSPAQGEGHSQPTDGFKFEGPRAGFEPWIGPGKPGHPSPSPAEPQPAPGPGVVFEPVMGFEPWLSGQTTSDPAIGPKYADKLTRAFGEQALLSIQDERIQGCAGYYFEGWESMGGDDFIKNVTVGRLGDKWEMVEYGTYELKSGSAGQRLSFDMANRQTVLHSYYDEQSYETTRHSEILRLDQDGTMRRETPPIGM
jgi:hypothetical protein